MGSDTVSYTLLKTPFGVTGSAISSEYYGPDADLWETLKAKWKVEHERMRSAYIEAGNVLGDAEYVDTDTLLIERSGEWRSPIIEEAD